MASCNVCGCELQVGEIAWASDWKVIDVSGTTVTFNTVTRYTCDGCERKRTNV